MGLEDITGDGDGKSTKRQAVTITRSEFEEFLDEVDEEMGTAFIHQPNIESKELVYESNAVMPDNSDVVLRIFSTIDERSQKSRPKGSDAIRLVVYHLGIESNIGGRVKTLRIKTWRKNLRKKIKSILEETGEYVRFCPDCEDNGRTGFLLKKSGQYGDFYGCTNYSKDNKEFSCTYTEQVE